MGTNILNVGVTGLNAAQAGIQTAGHNIANASTPGYSRQQIVQSTNTPMFTGSGFIGEGTNVSTVLRTYNQYLSGQVLTAQTGVAEMDSYQAQISQIDNLLADPNAGLSPALSAFFNSVQNVASNPTDIPSRQVVLSDAQSLVSRFQSINQRLMDIREGVNSQITSEVGVINSDSKQLANINQQIILAEASGPGQPPNDLLDQRDQIVADLNKHIRITTATQNDGSYSVFIGNGQPLVVGTQASSLQAVPARDDAQRIVVASKTSSGTTVTLNESLLSGGTLGGLLAFRSQSLDPAQNSLGRVATGLAQTFNTQHQLGQDLTGAMGGNFFNVGTPAVLPDSHNTGGITVSAAVTNVADLTSSDYRLSYSAAGTGSYSLTRLSDNVSWSADTLANLQPSAAAQGFSLAINPPNTPPGDGDSFLIQPTRNGARDIGVAVTDVRSIAAGTPIRTTATSTNIGTGVISPGSVNSPNVAFWAAVTVTFNSPQSYTLTYANGQPLFNPQIAIPYDPNAGANLSYNGWTAQISGSPASGDTFTIGPNSNGVADNRNALLLGQLQTQNTLAAPAGGAPTANFEAAYAEIVSQVGNKAREVVVTQQAQQSLATQAQSASDSVSGVNLDEEAANLMKYQQAYQAAAKVIAIAGKLFDTILTL